MLCPSPPPPPPEYRTIRPRPNNDGPHADSLDGALEFKPRKRKKRKLCQKSRRQPQERSDESKATQLVSEVNIVSSFKPGSERFGLPICLLLPQIPSWLKCHTTQFRSLQPIYVFRYLLKQSRTNLHVPSFVFRRPCTSKVESIPASTQPRFRSAFHRPGSLSSRCVLLPYFTRYPFSIAQWIP